MTTLAREKLDLASLDYRARPIEAFGRLRDRGPVVPARLTLIGDVWLITTYAAVDEALKRDDLFCRDPRTVGKRNFPMLRLLLPGMFKRLANNMIGADEPDHRRLRSLVDQAFQRQSISDMRPGIERLIDEQLDQLPGAADSDGAVDLVEHLCRPVPLAVICELLGLPAEDRPQFRRWFSGFANLRSMWAIPRMLPGLRRTMKYLEAQFVEVRQSPRPGLITALVEAEQEGQRLSGNELIAMAMLLLLAGHETTVHLLTNTLLTVLQLPDIRQQLQRDWSLVEAAVEESLRYNSPAQFAKPRYVREDMEFHGQSLRRGELIMPILASANYDPARFEAPEEFRLDRPRNYHLTFGAGPHVCLGLKLARAETQILLQRLLTRWPSLQPAFDPDSPDWSRRFGMRSLTTLRVTLDPSSH